MNIFGKIKRFYIIICMFLIPILTVCMTIVCMTIGSLHGLYEYMIVFILPIFLIIWFISLVISTLYEIVIYIRHHLESSVISIILYSFSVALFFICAFCVLFTRSVELGGFHAS